MRRLGDDVAYLELRRHFEYPDAVCSSYGEGESEIMKFRWLVLMVAIMFNVVSVWAQDGGMHTVGRMGSSSSLMPRWRRT
jgi:hypothetical protein